MTTYAPAATVFDQSSDAAFRAWIIEFHTLLTTAGLVNTSDTGQIDTATVTRPGAGSTSAGYKIYRFNDTLQATAPIFIKVEFGTGGSVTTPQIWLTVGTATNGAGSITPGAATTRSVASRSSAILSTVTPYTSRACVIEGCAWIAFKSNSTVNSGFGGFSIHRSCDSSGSPTADGFIVYFLNGSAITFGAQQVLVSGPQVSGVSSLCCMFPMGYVSGVVGSDLQYRKHYMATPRDRCNPFAMSVLVADVPEGTQRSMTPVGSTSHNYICIGFCLGHSTGAGAGSGNGLMLVWE